MPRQQYRTDIHPRVFGATVCLVTAYVACACAGTNAIEQMTVPVRIPLIELATNTQGETIFRGCRMSGEPGQPALPVVQMDILLPPDVDLASTRIWLTNHTASTVQGEFDVAPSPPYAKGTNTVWPQGVQIEAGHDVAAYATDAFLPRTYFGLVTKGQMREWRIATVMLYPYQWNPIAKQLVHLTGGDLVCQFQRIPDFRAGKTRSAVTRLSSRQEVRERVVNFKEMIGEYEK